MQPVPTHKTKELPDQRKRPWVHNRGGFGGKSPSSRYNNDPERLFSDMQRAFWLQGVDLGPGGRLQAVQRGQDLRIPCWKEQLCWHLSLIGRVFEVKIFAGVVIVYLIDFIKWNYTISAFIVIIIIFDFHNVIVAIFSILYWSPIVRAINIVFIDTIRICFFSSILATAWKGNIV